MQFWNGIILRDAGIIPELNTKQEFDPAIRRCHWDRASLIKISVLPFRATEARLARAIRVIFIRCNIYHGATLGCYTRARRAMFRPRGMAGRFVFLHIPGVCFRRTRVQIRLDTDERKRRVSLSPSLSLSYSLSLTEDTGRGIPMETFSYPRCALL